MMSKRNKMNKKGWASLLIWGGAALAAGIGYLINATKPAAATPTGVAGIFSAVPIWGWIVMILILLVLVRSR